MERIKSLVITGSNGFVGQSILDYIENLPDSLKPEKLTLISKSAHRVNNRSKLRNLDITYIECDLSKKWNFKSPGSVLINLAADGSQAAFSKDSADQFIRISKNLTDWASENKPKTIFHASSGASLGIKRIYGETASLSLTGEPASFNKLDFIESRIKAENNLLELNNENNIKIIIGRLYSFVGPRILSKKHYALPAFIAGALKNGVVEVEGNINTIRSYLHQEDMSEWIYRSLFVEKINSILNIGSSVPVKIKELAELIALETGSSVKYKNPDSVGDIYVADNAETLGILQSSENRKWKESVIECLLIAKGSQNYN